MSDNRNDSRLARLSPLKLCSLTLLVALALGCAGGSKAQQIQASHLRALVALYNSAANQMGRPPKSEEELKAFIQENGTKVLQRMKIAKVDDLLVSERDGQSFVVVYGKRPEGVRRDVVAYEQTGVDGVRQVGFSLGMIEEVDAQEFSELVRE